MRSSPRAVGIAAAVVTVAIWTGFIVIGRASAGRTLLPFDIALLRILGAGAVLLPWGWWLGRRAGATTSLGGLSPLPLRPTVLCGLFGGALYATLCYAGFFFAPAAHASVLMPGSLPLWTTLLAALLLGERITASRALGLACIVAGGLVVGGAGLWAALGGGSVVVSGISFVQMVRAFGPVRSTMITALVPGLSALGAALLLGEPLGWSLLAGLALVTAGILFGVRAARPKAPCATQIVASNARSASCRG